MSVSFDGYWDQPLKELLQHLPATPTGLTTAEAAARLRIHGPNSLVRESRFAALMAGTYLLVVQFVKTRFYRKHVLL